MHYFPETYLELIIAQGRDERLNQAGTRATTILCRDQRVFGPGSGGNGSDSPGVPKPWLGGGMAGLNLATGNKLTTIPIVSWTARGGLPVSFSLYHNSEGNYNGSFAANWNCSYESSVSFDNSGNPTITWDDGSTVNFTKSGSAYTPQVGEHGSFVVLQASGPTIYEYTTSGNVRYDFTTYSSLETYLTKISDLNGNALTINRSSSNPFQISTIVDPTSRQLSLTWMGSLLSSISDPLERVWQFGYTSGTVVVGGITYEGGPDGGITDDGNNYLLLSISLPLLAGQSTPSQIVFTYTQKTITIAGTAYPYYPGTIATLQDPNGNVSGWSYADSSAPNALTSAVDPAGNGTSISYAAGSSNGSGSTTISDSNGNQTVDYYVNGALDHVVNSIGTTVGQYTYDAYQNVSKVVDGRNLTWLFGFDSTGTNQTSVTNPDSKVTAFTFNSLNEPVSVTDALSNVEHLSYDGNGNLVSVRDALSHTGTITIPSGSYGLPSQKTDAAGNVTALAWGANGDLEAVTDPNGVTEYATANVLGWPISQTDAIGNMTVNTFDNWGRLIKVQRGGAQQQPLYRLDGAPGCLNGGSDSDDLNRIYTADPNFVSSMLVGGWNSMGVVGYLYMGSNSEPGLVALHRLLNGSQECYTASTASYNYFTANGWVDQGIVGYVYPSTTTNTTGLTPIYAAWNSSTNRNLYTTEAGEYNALTSPWQQQGVLCYLQGQAGSLQTVSTYTYDNNGNVLTYLDGNSNGYTAYYDADNRIISRVNTRANGTSGGVNDTVTYTYDQPNATTGASQKGLLSWTVNGNGAKTSYAYDALNRTVRITLPDATTRSITSFDGNSNPLTMVDGNGVMKVITYDNENRVVGSGFSSSSGNPVISYNKAFAYDADGRLIGMNDVMGSSGWWYDAAGRVTQVTTPNGTVSYGYDAVNRMISRSISGIGTWSYSFHNNTSSSLGTWLMSATSPYGETTSYSYDADGRPVTKTLANGIVQQTTYDDQNRVTDINFLLNSSADTPFEALHYAFDAGGRIISSRRDGSGQLSLYSYDGANQLLEQNVTYSGSTQWYDEKYTYDHNGNRLTHVFNNAATDTFTYDAGDKLQSVSGGNLGSRVYQYDNNGSLIAMFQSGNPVFNIVYDWDGRQITYAPCVYSGGSWTTSPSAGSVWTNSRYNGLGLRLQKEDGTGTYNYLTDGTTPGSPVLSDGAAVYTDGLSERRGGVSKFYLSDMLGSTDELTDSTGTNVTDVAEYNAFGNVYGRSGTDPTPFMYGGGAGYQTDSGSGLLLLGNRYYDPTVGRFVSRDPAGAGDNWYAYCGNNPANAIDPTGLDWELFATTTTWSNKAGESFSDTYYSLKWVDEPDDEMNLLLSPPSVILQKNGPLAIDTNGMPGVTSSQDGNHDPKTSLRYHSNNGSLNAATVPYLAYPHNGTQGMAPGDFAAVVYNGTVVGVILGDSAGSKTYGEASVDVFQMLGVNPQTSDGSYDNGIESGVTIVGFPGSGSSFSTAGNSDVHPTTTITSPSFINVMGGWLFSQLPYAPLMRWHPVMQP